LASAGSDKNVRLWGVSTGRQQRELRGHTATVRSVSFDPNDQRLASASTDQSVRLWTLATGKDRVLGKQLGRVYKVAFHPDGQRVAAASSDGKARIWNIQTGQQAVLRGHQEEVNSLAFSSDGAFVATVSDDTTVRLWHADTARPYWHAPIMFGSPPWLLSHRGWQQLEPKPGTPPGTPPSGLVGPRARRAIEKRARYATGTGLAEGKQSPLVCIHTYDESVELWSLRDDQLLAEKKLAGIEQVLAINEGCVARARKSVWLLTKSGTPISLPISGQASAACWNEQRLLVATNAEILVFDGLGKLAKRFAHSGIGVTALASQGLGERAAKKAPSETRQCLVVGYSDGNVELLPTDETTPKPSLSFEHVPASSPMRMLVGPGNSLIVGYANGVLGIWSLRDGTLLGREHIHGPVVHLLLEGQKLYAASELGGTLSWDLRPLYVEYCELLRHIWTQVPVIWQSGYPLVRPPPIDHQCRQVR